MAKLVGGSKVTEKDCQDACEAAGACFAIYWDFDESAGVLRAMSHWNPPERVAAVKSTGDEEMYTTCSYKVGMTPGTGIVGKVFREMSRIVISDVTQVAEIDYRRKALAARFGIQSLALKPYKGGVMEVGSTTPWATCEWAHVVGVEECKWAAEGAGADFAIYWGFDKSKGILRPVSHWNPPERIADVKASTGKGELYTTCSHTEEMSPGDGFVGKSYTNKEPMFFPDVSEVLSTEYKRKDLALKFGIVSLALKPFGDGVLEMGTTKKWDTCDFVNTVTSRDCERAAREAGASFALYWGFDESRSALRPMAHWSPPELSEFLASTGNDEFYTTESYRCIMKPGEGYVGKSFKNRESMFFPCTSQLLPGDFKRKALAERFGVQSLAFKPFANGVMEVGSAEKWESCKWVDTVTVEDCQKVCRESGASFCIFWDLDKAQSVLKPTCHWNPPERISVVRATTGNAELYSTESYKVQMKPGEGLVGNAYQKNETVFFPDVSKLSSDDFKRKDLASQFGVVSLAFKRYGVGIFEIGSVRKWDTCLWVNTVSVDHCRKVCMDTNASFAVFWAMDQAKGVLKPACHWNPPEHVAAVKAANYSDDNTVLFSSESFSVEARPGEGVVGKAYQDKKAMSFPDVSQFPDFHTHLPSEQVLGIASVALWPFAGGIFEVGAVGSQKLEVDSLMTA